MARPPKYKAIEAGKAADAPPNKVIDIDNFIRVRDSVYARLTTIQDLIKSFSVDYLRQTNLLLGEGTNLENGADISNLENALNLLAPPAVAAAPVEEKKERKKRQHDPNAPKRPLTPYFLYMQTARPIIAQDLGPEAAKGAVQEEGQRRWSTMNPHDKAGWDQAYQYNLRLYNARVHAYKHGNANAKLMTDDEALRYADEMNIEMPHKDAEGGNDQDAIAEQLQQHAAEEAATKTPKSAAKKDNRKRKSEIPAEAAKAGTAATTAAAAASPDKKRKRASKVTEEKEPEPKKSGRKKAKSG